jgi:organic hydroperoxide reductase OsmC/OhrA
MEHRATIAWRRTSTGFTYDTYNRDHEVRFHGMAVPASAAPEFKGTPERMNPEEAFVAALSSCHMLTFLAFAARKKFSLDSYDDDAVGYLEKNANGKLAMMRAVLRPKVVWSPGVTVTREELEALHQAAHENCFIALSVNTDVKVEPQA